MSMLNIVRLNRMAPYARIVIVTWIRGINRDESRAKGHCNLSAKNFSWDAQSHSVPKHKSNSRDPWYQKSGPRLNIEAIPFLGKVRDLRSRFLPDVSQFFLLSFFFFLESSALQLVAPIDWTCSHRKSNRRTSEEEPLKKHMKQMPTLSQTCTIVAFPILMAPNLFQRVRGDGTPNRRLPNHQRGIIPANRARRRLHRFKDTASKSPHRLQALGKLLDREGTRNHRQHDFINAGDVQKTHPKDVTVDAVHDRTCIKAGWC